MHCVAGGRQPAGRAHTEFVVESDAYGCEKCGAGVDFELVVVPRRRQVAAECLDHGQLDALLLHVPVGPAVMAQPVGAAHFEPDQIVRVVGHTHLVGVGIAHAHSTGGDRRVHVVLAHRPLPASVRSARVALSASGVPKMAFPATRIRAPAFTNAAAWLRSPPPSTAIGTQTPARSSIARRRVTLSMECGMKAWPPNPGFTVMTSTKSSCCVTSSSAPMGVEGLRTAPALAPTLRIRLSVRCRCGTASTCTEIIAAPFAAKASMYRSGASIIRCTSSGRAATRCSAFSTG